MVLVDLPYLEGYQILSVETPENWMTVSDDKETATLGRLFQKKSLNVFKLRGINFEATEVTTTLCQAMAVASIEKVVMYDVTFPPMEGPQIAAALMAATIKDLETESLGEGFVGALGSTLSKDSRSIRKLELKHGLNDATANAFFHDSHKW